ncbi:MAG: tRNA dihydrouridine synthase DusB [Candidatus Theseobacter exili]|nr:tRNA dihydrouridine synthase DusB [Candidatus Theseobacter exili]
MKITPLFIGNLKIDYPIFLAPMAGYTNSPFRYICKKFHCGMVFTELVTAEGILRRSAKTMLFLDSFKEERPIAAHIYGKNPDSLAGAAQIIDSLNRFDSIDINCGCPVQKIVKKDAGAALMKDPEKIKSMVKIVTQATSLPVTIKTRLGLSKNCFNIFEVAQAAEEGGAKAIFVHARFASQKHIGHVDLNALSRVKKELNIPVIGNGSILNSKDALNMFNSTGVDGIMIGRGAIGNPWIFDEIFYNLSDSVYKLPTPSERKNAIEEHLRRLHNHVIKGSSAVKRSQFTSEQVTCIKFRNHLLKYLIGMKGLDCFRKSLVKINTISDMLIAIDNIFKFNKLSIVE